MPARTSYLDGEPCWADVQTPDPQTTQHFYGALFGWTFRSSGPEFGDYVMCSKDDRLVAGITPPPPGAPANLSTRSNLPTPSNLSTQSHLSTPSHLSTWSVYLATSDIEQTARRVEQAGGKLLTPPMEVPAQGRMLVAMDPTGAAFGAWQAAGHAGAAVEGEPGAASWTELKTRDGAAADAFYRALFPYAQQQIGDGERFDYSVWSIDGEQVSGRHRLGDDIPADVPPHWMVYFAVDDADVAAQTILAAGGELLQGPHDSPYGRLVVAADPLGALFSVVDLSRRTGSTG
jgi:predicted enzyme related to lactoylglutathione lyase